MELVGNRSPHEKQERKGKKENGGGRGRGKVKEKRRKEEENKRKAAGLFMKRKLISCTKCSFTFSAMRWNSRNLSLWMHFLVYLGSCRS